MQRKYEFSESELIVVYRLMLNQNMTYNIQSKNKYQEKNQQPIKHLM